MIRQILKRAAFLVPSIRRLRDQRDDAIRQIGELSIRLRELGATPPGVNVGAVATSNSVATIERALSLIRAEFTPLPRFAYHLPLDYEKQTLPPKFDRPVWVDGENLPLPPRADRHGHAADDTEYLAWGKYDHDVILAHIQRELPNIDGLSVMDFGCSSGRVLRHFFREAREKNWKLTGVDVSARHIEWMRRNFPREFQVYTGSVMPILPFESNSFDVIYGNSVFTHMKYLWDMWLLELRRVLKPGGVVVQSIHTENAWNFFVEHSHEEWARSSLGPMIIDQKELPADFVYYGDIAENQVFWKRDVAIGFWSRYLKYVKVYPPPEKYSYQDWIVGKKAMVDEKDSITSTSRPKSTEDLPTAMLGSVEQVLDDDVVIPMFTVGQDFSQNGEQRIILDFFSRYFGRFNAYCVDAGAYDGVVGSNSRALFLNGWRGTVIEPNPRTFARLKELYAGQPDVTCIQKALSDRCEENVVMKFALGPSGTSEEDKWKYAQVSTLNDDFAASYERDYGYIYETSTVSTDTLNNVLRAAGAPKDIGFLSIDCEGEDIKIVRTMDLQTFRPLLICVESDDNNRHFYAEILGRQGYTLHSKTVGNSFFRLKE